MRRHALLSTLALAAALAAVPFTTGAGDPPPHAHEPADPHAAHAHEATPGPATLPDTKYATDQPLRAAMAAIDAALPAAHPGDRAGTLALADTIDASIASMIANCRLAPEADAALHGIIGRLARDAATLRKRPADEAALASIEAALHDYARTFDPPGFEP